MKGSYTIIDSIVELELFYEDLEKSEAIGYDLETWGLDWHIHRIRLAQYNVNDNIYILNVENDHNCDTFRAITQRIKDSGKSIIAHNVKFEIKFTLQNTSILLDKVYDTQLVEVMLTAGVGNFYPSLNSLTELYANVELGKDIRMSFTTEEVITNEMYLYAALDVKYLEQIKTLQTGEVTRLKLDKILDLELRLLPVVAMMEYDGVSLDATEWMKLYNTNVENKKRADTFIRNTIFDKLIEPVFNMSGDAHEAYFYLQMPKNITKTREKHLKSITDGNFMYKELISSWNPNSHAQLRTALNLCGYRMSNGKELPGTAEAVLSPLKGDELIQTILNYKEYSKRVSSFGDSWLTHINEWTNRIHTSWHQYGTATGRWASSKPNMQNIIADETYRKCFTAREGYKLITCDYSQAELRIVGAVSGETNIINAYIKGEDIHARTASIIFGIPLATVSKTQRDIGKTINFVILYGGGPKRISEAAKGIDFYYAKELLERFFAGYPRLKKFLDTMGQAVWNRKMSRTPMGRIRFFEDKTVFKDEREFFKYKSKVQREGNNHIVQGGSADALKVAMVNMFENNPYGHDNFRLLIQVHDEVVVEVREDLAEEGLKFIVDNMEEAEQQFLGSIPAVAGAKIADYWKK